MLSFHLILAWIRAHTFKKEQCPARKKVKSLSHVQLFVTSRSVAYQAPLSMESSRQEYWSGVPFPSPGDLPNSGIEPGSPTLQADASPSETPGKCSALTKPLKEDAELDLLLAGKCFVFLFFLNRND